MKRSDLRARLQAAAGLEAPKTEAPSQLALDGVDESDIDTRTLAALLVRRCLIRLLLEEAGNPDIERTGTGVTLRDAIGALKALDPSSAVEIESSETSEEFWDSLSPEQWAMLTGR